jgi:hypothetical protein
MDVHYQRIVNKNFVLCGPIPKYHAFASTSRVAAVTCINCLRILAVKNA